MKFGEKVHGEDIIVWEGGNQKKKKKLSICIKNGRMLREESGKSEEREGRMRKRAEVGHMARKWWSRIWTRPN